FCIAYGIQTVHVFALGLSELILRQEHIPKCACESGRVFGLRSVRRLNDFHGPSIQSLSLRKLALRKVTVCAALQSWDQSRILCSSRLFFALYGRLIESRRLIIVAHDVLHCAEAFRGGGVAHVVAVLGLFE